MKTKSLSGLDAIVVFLVVAIAAAILSIDTTLNAYAQNTTTIMPQPSQNQTAADPQQIKNYLNQAIQSLDSGNNTQALEQVDLAEDQLESITGTESADDQLESITGTESADDEDDDEEEEEGEIEEGPGEDEDEPRDIDTNDEEDTP